MKKLSVLIAAVAGLTVLALATPSLPAEKGKEKTIKGEAKCAKCTLKEAGADKCQTVIEVENAKTGKTQKFYLADNTVAKDFHENVCKAPKKVVATGTVKKVDGKNEFTASKIEVAKDK